MLGFGSTQPYAVGIFLGAAVSMAAWNWGGRTDVGAVPGVRDAQELSDVFRHVAAETMPSIVSIETMTKSRQVEMQGMPFDDEASPFREFFREDPRFREFFRQQPQQRRGMAPSRRGAGSGFIIDGSGIIMTNNHVVQDADVVRVRLHDGREFVAKDVKTDPRTDVAIVRIEGAGPLKPIKLGDSRAMQVGDWVLAFGTPFGLESTVTQGIISGKGRARAIADREDFLQTDAAINPGNSGGPLVNLRGEVIGINTAIASASGGYDGIGFAVPTHIAGWVGEHLIRDGVVKRGYLGTSIAEVNAEAAQQFKSKVREGAIVRGVMPNSPAEKAGLEPGDVILTLNGQKVATPASLQGIVEQLTIGQAYPLEISRNGQSKSLTVKIEAMPDDYSLARANRSRSETPSVEVDKFGLQVKTLTKDLAQQLQLPNATGVVVTKVDDGSLADDAGIATGDVIERVGEHAVTSVDDFQKAMESHSLKDGIVLHLRNAEGKRYVILKDEMK